MDTLNPLLFIQLKISLCLIGLNPRYDSSKPASFDQIWRVFANVHNKSDHFHG